MSGIRMSKRQTSGRSSRARRRPRGRPPPRRPPRCRAGRRGSCSARCGRSPGRRRPPRGWSSRPGAALGRTALTVQPPVGVRAGLEAAAEQRGALGHADQAVARGCCAGAAARRRRGPSACTAAVRTVDGDVDAGRVAGVPHRVGDRLLRDAVDRRPDRGRQVVEVAVSSTSTRGRPRRASQPLEVGDAPLRRQLGRLAVAQHPTIARISASVRDASPRSPPAPRPAASGSGRADDPAGLGADRDGRDVVGDGVVQLAGELLALAEPAPARARAPGGRAGSAPRPRAPPGTAARRPPTRPRRPSQSAASPRTRRHARSAACPTAISRPEPTGQRVGQQQDADHRCRDPTDAPPAIEELDDVSTVAMTPKATARRRERVGTPPQQHRAPAPRRPPGRPGATPRRGGRRLSPRAAATSTADQRPVPPHPRRGVRGPGLGPQRAEGVRDHRPSLGSRPAAHRPKGRACSRPIGRVGTSPRADVGTAGCS